MNEVRNIILTDDHAIVRQGLKILIEKIGPYKISGEYGNGRELVQDYPFTEKPDMLILDLDMPVMDGAEVVLWMKEKNVNLPTLVLTLNDDENLIVRLFHMGVRGYLHKNCSSDMLKKAITEILGTGYYHNELLTKAMLTPTKHEETPHVTEQLSDREMEFLQLVCHQDEYTYDRIAQLMQVGRRTVDNYREAIFFKYGIKSKTGMVLFAIKHGVVKV